MPGESRTTTNHDEIRAWAELRGGMPVAVKGTGEGGEPGVLRIEFHDERLEPISWEEFFRKFDESNLAFLYQNETVDGKESRFFKLVER